MLKIIGSADPKYLAATDLLIGDMSNINYEFLLYDRPVVLLANDWIKTNFPDIGIKTDLNGLHSAITHSLLHPHEYQMSRKTWLNLTISQTSEKASKRNINTILEKSGIRNPEFCFVDGGNAVRKTNLLPLIEEVDKRGFSYVVLEKKKKRMIRDMKNVIIVAAHFQDLWADWPGYKVHIDHDLKGVATANLEYAVWDYKRHAYFPHIDMHITAGEAGDRRTKLVLGPFCNRTYIAGYPKADHFLKLNTIQNRKSVYKELELQENVPIVTYAPAGEKNFMKPGGSLCEEVIDYLRTISKTAEFHILVKMKYENTLTFKLRQALKKINIFQNEIHDDGSKWRSLFS